ncbi:hypothetical protein AVEN_149419-1 [Araneus ventricosus]|uniref:Uncharacterized protein n=1 Tax=Araneus ventricosus TaxID=182803 RepID=A0A4Y2P8V4_ARAVE|nr:hypothetical protein AVEN_149419-1 [Araneus ventricosus]
MKRMTPEPPPSSSNFHTTPSREHEGYFGTDFVILISSQMMRKASELAPLSPNFRFTPAGGHLGISYGLAYNRPHARRISSGIGFRIWKFPVPKPRPYHSATEAHLSRFRSETCDHFMVPELASPRLQYFSD